MPNGKTKVLIVLAVLLVIVVVVLGLVRKKGTVPSLITTLTPTPQELSSQQQLELLKRNFAQDTNLEEKTKELTNKLPGSLEPLVNKIREIVNLSEFEKVEFKDGNIGYRTSFTTEKSLNGIYMDLIRLIATQGWKLQKGSRTTKAFILEFENNSIGFKLNAEANLEQNTKIKGIITFTSVK